MLEEIEARSILQKVKYDSDKWFGIDYNINLYKGCCHGCIYCDSRSECYRIDNFDKVRIKANALEILETELRKKRAKGVIGLGAMSDTYNPFERSICATRNALKLIAAYGFGVSIDTKGTLVTRDIDYLQQITAQHSAIVKLTITTADDRLSGLIEPHAPKSSERFRALRTLSEAGIYSGLLLMPVLPFLTDTEENIRRVVALAAQNGAKFIYGMFGVTMRDGQREYLLEQLKALSPELPQKYIETYGNQYVCSSPRMKECWSLFRRLCEEHGLSYRMKDIIEGYQRKETYQQINLFD